MADALNKAGGEIARLMGLVVPRFHVPWMSR